MGRQYFLMLGMMFYTVAGVWAGTPNAPHSTTIRLERPIHFVAPGGADIIAAPDTYTVTAVEHSRLLLIPEKGQVPVLIEAQTTTHEEDLASPRARLIPGDGDEPHVLLLLPGGQGRDAVGSYSGARTRVAVPPAPAPSPMPGSASPPQPRAGPVSPPGGTVMPAGAPKSPTADQVDQRVLLQLVEGNTQILSALRDSEGTLAALQARIAALEQVVAALDAKLAAQHDALEKRLEAFK